MRERLLYHVTPRANRQSIRTHGLVPQRRYFVGSAFNGLNGMHGEARLNSLFCWEDPQQAIRWARNEGNEFYDCGEPSGYEPGDMDIWEIITTTRPDRDVFRNQ